MKPYEVTFFYYMDNGELDEYSEIVYGVDEQEAENNFIFGKAKKYKMPGIISIKEHWNF